MARVEAQLGKQTGEPLRSPTLRVVDKRGVLEVCRMCLSRLCVELRSFSYILCFFNIQFKISIFFKNFFLPPKYSLTKASSSTTNHCRRQIQRRRAPPSRKVARRWQHAWKCKKLSQPRTIDAASLHCRRSRKCQVWHGLLRNIDVFIVFLMCCLI